MMKVMVITALALCLASCGGKKEVGEQIDLKTFKDKISYIVGSKQAEMITRSGDPNLDKLSFDDMVDGFESGLSDKPALDAECENALKKLYGPYGQDFDTNYLKKGCACIGRLAGSAFYTKWNGKGVMDQFDMKIVETGFNHGLFKKDTLVDVSIATKMYVDFLTDINKKSGEMMMVNANKLPNVETIEGGIVLETIEAGTGANPTPTDDVKVNYIVITAEGDTIENSFAIMEQNGQPIPAFNLQGVIPGWGLSFPNFQKGGKYHAYIPWEMAYGERDQCESLKFYIELLDFGPKGSLVKAPEMQPQMQGMPPQ